MTELDVTLTDYLVSALSAQLFRGLAGRVRAGWYRCFFASVGLSAFVGGTVHGFWVDESCLGYKILWPICLMLLGGSGLAAWNIGADLLSSTPRGWLGVRWLAAILYLKYCAILLFCTDNFLVPVCFCLPAMLFWVFAALIGKHVLPRVRLQVSVGVGLTFLSALIQQLGLGLSDSFNHNALAHTVQMLGLVVLYRAALNQTGLR